VLALEQLGRVAGVFHVLDAALQLAVRVGQHLAVLGGDQGAILSAFSSSSTFSLLITRARLSGGVLRQAGKAASALAMAASTVALLASATLVVDWPVAGLNTGCVRCRVGNDLAVDQVADGGGDVLVVVHQNFKNEKCL
jgi:hypothetical protein